MASEAVIGKVRVPFDTVRERGARAAAGLAQLGVGEGDAVAIALRNDIPYLEALIATTLVGAYAVPLNWHFKAEEIAYIVADSGARVVVAHADLVPGFAAKLPPDVKILTVPTPGEIARAYNIPPQACAAAAGATLWSDWLQGFAPFAGEKRAARGSIVYTSGTTGQPKGVRREALEGEARRRFEDLMTAWFDLKPGIRTVMAGPMYHSAPNTYAKAAMIANGSVVLMPRFDAEELLRVIQDERITHIHLVPTMFARLLKLPAEVRTRYDVSSLEFVIHGAAPCPPDVKRRMIEWWGPVIYEYYGATEIGMISRSDSAEWLRKPGTVGRVWPGRRVCIYDDLGNVVPPGTVGEIYSSLDLVPQFAYVNQESQRQAIERDGLITNGDLGYLDEDGHLFLCDRKRDMVISGGVNIYPAEIESALVDCPGVRDCAVFGIPDEEYGEAVAVAIEVEPGASPTSDQIRAFLRERLANYKVPRHIVFEAKLPRDDSGKLMKRVLKEPYWQGAGRRI